MSELLRLENIHKAYLMGPAVVPVLRGIDLNVLEGEFVAIMGASGSGKSTLLHIAGALDKPDTVALGGNTANGQEPAGNGGKPPTLAYTALRGRAGKAVAVAGEVFFRGKAYSTMGRHGRHRLRNHELGFVFQFYHLLAELNVLENVLLPAMVDAPFYLAFVRGRPRKAEALALLDAFGLSERLKHRPGELSGGERQRVAIARALINNPALLLADEPTGNLDAKTGRTILDVLLNLHKQRGQTILLVTHDPQVAALADRIVHLEEGRIRAA
jgi:lipoprotein-releasing system ATP-binding protein